MKKSIQNISHPENTPGEGEARSRRESLQGTLPGALFLLFLILLLPALFRIQSESRLLGMEEENQRLHRELASLENRMQELEGSLEETERFEIWTRHLAELAPLDDAALEGGVGGPGLPGFEDVASTLARKLEGLLGRAHVLKQSAEEVYGELLDSREELSRIPSIWPLLKGRTTSRYGRRIDPFTGKPSFHRGLDLGAPKGTPIFSTADGRVRKVRYSNVHFGNTVEVDHGNGFVTRYAHCDRIEVSKGQKVARGDVIAGVGSTGHSTAPHLHYEVIRDDKAMNPRDFILARDFVVD
ncbi:MAG: M23 family metallopeptidase [Candidatus Krumholzibacteria bacterium]|jgi:murein DD-endopeptidase MepM/ murein hydrolase activator NlpD|nr:M23 family metallopeptidase [Candidatus Krumholzibacteria bacterium]MDP6796500.1 M23 family metallopeptidase [Candidatus Krumholzibacteria bacterium]MDP7021935.1 M23 family metallopeptidase [Candidatus Krumholzibacteria bacterium]